MYNLHSTVGECLLCTMCKFSYICIEWLKIDMRTDGSANLCATLRIQCVFIFKVNRDECCSCKTKIGGGSNSSTAEFQGNFLMYFWWLIIYQISYFLEKIKYYTCLAINKLIHCQIIQLDSFKFDIFTWRFIRNCFYCMSIFYLLCR